MLGLRTLCLAKIGTWIAMDFEAWDRDHTVLTEIGWRLVQWVYQQHCEGAWPPRRHRPFSQQ